MEYVKLGNTGLDVSRLCLGCMGFGDADKWLHQWVLNEEDSRPVIKKALDLGINFFDTANVYSLGASEEYLGRALKDYANRDEVVIATKVHGTMHKGPNGSSLSRKAIMSEIDKSLKRLETDYVDLYIIHRWDYNTLIEETLEALHDIVKARKVRYIGASAMYAWQFQKALHIAEKNGWTKFVFMQNHLNLIYREEEREMLPLCKEEKIGVTPYSPLASGRLTRDLSVFFLFIAYGGITTFIPLFADSLKVNSGTFFLVYAATLVLSRPIAGKLSDRYGEMFVIMPALVITIVALIALSFSTGLFGVLLSAVIYGIGFGAAQPALQG